MLAVWFGLGLLFLAFHPGLPRHPPKKKNTHNQTAPNRQRLKDINHQKTYDLRILRTCCFPSTLQLLIQTVSLTFSNVTPREKQWQQILHQLGMQENLANHDQKKTTNF